jgi:hypothetical protein
MNELGLEVKAPLLTSLDLNEICKFLTARENYERTIKEKNAGVPSARKIISVSVKSSINFNLLQLISEMELDASIENITDYDLINFLSQRGKSSLKNNDET